MACTTIGCVDGLSLELAPPGGTWAPGKYVFEVTTPAGTTRCEGALPLPACESGPALACSGPPVSIGESGCALPKDQHGFSTLDLPTGPAHVEVAITHEGKPLTRFVLDPTYRTVQPNGPTCEPTCRQANASIKW